MKNLVFAPLLVFVIFAVSAFAQSTVIDISKIPTVADKFEQFVPAGWKVESAVNDDFSSDGVPDYAIEIVEDKPAVSESDRHHVLILAFCERRSDKLKRVAVADNLPLCCEGGINAPVRIRDNEGSLVISQLRQSPMKLTLASYEFAFDLSANKLLLIEFDYSSRDAKSTDYSVERTSYLNGSRTTITARKGVAATKTVNVAKKFYSIDEINWNAMAAESAHRLGLD